MVSIPLPQIDIPRFRFGNKDKGGVGQGEGEVGDPLGKGDPARTGRARPATRPGEHALEVELSLEELAEILGEELQLPNIEPKGKKRIISQKDRYVGIRRTGPESLRHFKRTFRQALRRQLMTGTYDAEGAAHHPDARGPALPLVEDLAAAAVERRHHLHDGRVGLDGRRAEGDRAHRVVLDRYLAALAVQRARDALHHPRRRRARRSTATRSSRRASRAAR